METQAKNYSLRIERDLKEWVKARAKSNNRSMNAEIGFILKEKRMQEEEEQQKKAA